MDRKKNFSVLAVSRDFYNNTYKYHVFSGIFEAYLITNDLSKFYNEQHNKYYGKRNSQTNLTFAENITCLYSFEP